MPGIFTRFHVLKFGVSKLNLVFRLRVSGVVVFCAPHRAEESLVQTSSGFGVHHPKAGSFDPGGGPEP